MINDGINDVPDKTIVIFTDGSDTALDKNRLLKIIKKNDKKRDWFTPHFYRCLPLSIGNQYGFSIVSEFDFSFRWNGNNDKTSVFLTIPKEVLDSDKTKENILYPNIQSHFGSGIITITPPFFFKTPPGVNLMTINPPNYVIPNITVMTGVVETDNLRFSFTFNLKIQIPDIIVEIPAGTPLASFIPIPRYFVDSFDLKFAEDIFKPEIIEDEISAFQETWRYRKEVEPTLKDHVNKQYMMGTDVYGNKFKDHQRP